MRSIAAITTFIFCLLAGASSHAEYTYTTIDHPSATDTYLYGTDGNNIVGWYSDASGDHSFKFDGSNFIPLDNPGGTSTHLHGINGDNIVGSYIDSSGIRHGTLYDGNTWHHRSSSTFKNDLYGIDGAANMVGYSRKNGTQVNTQGTLYDGSQWTNFNYPGSTSTTLHGVNGANKVGAYTDEGGGTHGVFHDGSTWTTLDHPLATSNTFMFGIDGDLMVGGYGDSSGEHGLLYNLSSNSWETLDVDVPGATNTFIHGIDGANMVGFYTDSSGNFHGFTASVSVPFANPSPEPSTLLLALFGLALVPRRRRR
jgi:MYXO-CTERM domain-containing protein